MTAPQPLQNQNQILPEQSHRRTTYDMSAVSECNDGTLCENHSRCVPHPYKEGSYMCDCVSASDASPTPTQYAGLYCEHPATTYCQKDAAHSSHAFCTNSGSCLTFVSKNQAHTGCKCPKGYEGEYCQYVVGSVPDWEFDVAKLKDMGWYTGLTGGHNSNANNGGVLPIVGIVVGSVVGFIAIAVMLTCFLWTGTITDKIIGMTKKKSGSMKNLNGNGESEFVGGQSVYRKRKSTRAVVLSPQNVDADGGVLTEVMREKEQEQELEEIGSPRKEELQEVDLDDLPSSLDEEDKKEII